LPCHLRRGWPYRNGMLGMNKRLVILFGPPAVGKMAVGLELARITGMRLFHNHMAIEPVLRIFPYGSASFNLIVRNFRNMIFAEAARADMPGLIYTCMWDLDDGGTKEYIDEVVSLFGSNGASAHFVELAASLDVRLRRNRTELRLAEKPSKRDVAASEARLLANENRRLNTTGEFFYPDRHIRLDTSNMTASAAARRLATELGLVESAGRGLGR
jgi:hypothetical protein